MAGVGETKAVWTGAAATAPAALTTATAGNLRPELLAPAGDWDCLRAAAENGAEAVYFGLATGFNARARAANFAVEELAAIADFLHRRAMKGYVTLNTLVFSQELAEFERVARVIATAGLDAVIVQDLGAIRLLRELCPELPVHASTQTTMTSAETIAVLRNLDVARVILARELSVAEVAKIRNQTDMPLELFVHGALCVAYSGQCLTSESLGGRSANRGQCAQACRLPYQVLRDGELVPLDQMKYVLSPQDLAGYAVIPELIRLGICSLKIEGRLKTPEYVANIVHHYRLAIDQALADGVVALTPQQVETMEMSFSRGFSTGWLHGCDHKALVRGISPKKRGVCIGSVCGIRGNRVLVQLTGTIKPGDGVVFEEDVPETEEQGGRVYEVFPETDEYDEPMGNAGASIDPIVGLTFAHHSLDFRRLVTGQKIWKTDDPELTRRLRKTFIGPHPQRRVLVHLHIEALVGAPLRVTARAENSAQAELILTEPLAAARQHPLTVETLRQQFGRLGGTLYELGQLTAEIVGGPMVPFSVLGKLRHQLLAQLDRSLDQPSEWPIHNESALDRLRQAIPATTSATEAPAQLRILCRQLAQIEPIAELGIRSVYVDFHDIREYAAAVRVAHQLGMEIYLATPRIQKPGEFGIFRVLCKHQPDGVLVRNLSGLQFYTELGIPVVADFSLNAANELTVHWLKQLGAQRITASYDLNRDQLLELVQAVPSAWLEVVLHQHMPMFHMEHCVFCAVLSPGTNKTNCGRPCDRHDVQLRDRVGLEHPLVADVGCRNTLFNATPQSGSELVPMLRSQGVSDFRIELLHQTPTECQRVVRLYLELLQGKITGREVWTKLRAINRVGVTRGTLEG